MDVSVYRNRRTQQAGRQAGGNGAQSYETSAGNKTAQTAAVYEQQKIIDYLVPEHDTDTERIQRLLKLLCTRSGMPV